MKSTVRILRVFAYFWAPPKHARFNSSRAVRFSSDRLNRLTQFMENKVADGTMVGGLGVIARNGKVIYCEPRSGRSRSGSRDGRGHHL